MAVIGVIVAALSAVLIPVLALLAAFASNPCGAFGDACDDYGSTPIEFVVLMGLTAAAIGAFVVGVVLAIVGLSRPDRAVEG